MVKPLWWIDLSRQPKTHPAPYLLPSPTGKRERGRQRRAMAYGNSLIAEAKAAHRRRTVHIGSQNFSSSLKSRASAHVKLTWEYKRLNHECPHFLLLSLRLVLSMMSHDTENLCGQFGSAVAAVSCLCFLPTPRLLAGSGVRKRKSLDVMQALFSNSPNTGVLSTLL